MGFIHDVHDAGVESNIQLASTCVWAGIGAVQLLAFCRQPRLVVLAGLNDRSEPAWALGALAVALTAAFWLQSGRFSSVLSLQLPVAVQCLGVAVGAAALALFAAVHWSLGLSWNPSVALQSETQALVTSGPYALARHPLYTSVLLMSLFSLLLGWWVVSTVFALAFAYFLVVRIPAEDRLMERQFGDEWRKWRDRTGAVLPKPVETLCGLLDGPPSSGPQGAAGDGGGSGRRRLGGSGPAAQEEHAALLGGQQR